MDDATTELDICIKWCGEAWARSDVEALEALLSPTYIHTDGSGTTRMGPVGWRKPPSWQDWRPGSPSPT
jgi:hypothetical protein